MASETSNKTMDKPKNESKPPKRNRVKETFAELKKVTWPSFGKVVKQTFTVLVVTVFFMLILMLMDWLLGLGHEQLITGLGDTASSVSSGVMNAMGIGGTAAPVLPLLI